VITWKNSRVDSSNYSYINTKPYSTTASATATNLFTKLVLDNIIFDNSINTGTQSGFIPLDFIVNNSIVRCVNPIQASGASNVTFHSLVISNVFISEEYNSLVNSITANLIKLANVTLADNNNQNSFSQWILALSLPYQSMTVNIEVENLYAGKPVNQFIYLLNIPANTSSITAQYNIKWKGMGWSGGWRLGSTGYYDPNGFATIVNANPSYLLSVDFTYFDLSNNILYRVTKNPNTPSTPSVPASGTAQVNTNSYPVEVYISGGSATQVQVTRNGSTYTIWSASSSTAIPSLTVRLNSGDSITITYSAAPSWTWLPA